MWVVYDRNPGQERPRLYRSAAAAHWELDRRYRNVSRQHGPVTARWYSEQMLTCQTMHEYLWEHRWYLAIAALVLFCAWGMAYL